MLHNILLIVSALVTFILGIIAKKHPKVNNNLIPIQNLLIGIISSVIYYIFTKDISLVLTGVGLFTGGTYDLLNNLNKLKKEEWFLPFSLKYKLLLLNKLQILTKLNMEYLDKLIFYILGKINLKDK